MVGIKAAVTQRIAATLRLLVLGFGISATAGAQETPPAIQQYLNDIAPVSLFGHQQRVLALKNARQWADAGPLTDGAQIFTLSRLDPKDWPDLAYAVDVFFRAAVPYPLEVNADRFSVYYYSLPTDLVLFAEYRGTPNKAQLARAFFAPGDLLRGTLVRNTPGWFTKAPYTEAIPQLLVDNLKGITGQGRTNERLFDVYLRRLNTAVLRGNSPVMARFAAQVASTVSKNLACGALYTFVEQDFNRAVALASVTNVKNFPAEHKTLGRFLPSGGFAYQGDTFVRFYSWETMPHHLYTVAMRGEGAECQLTSLLAFDLHEAEMAAVIKSKGTF